MDSFANILNFVDPKSSSPNGANLLSRENFQKSNEQAAITKVGVEIVNMVTSLNTQIMILQFTTPPTNNELLSLCPGTSSSIL